LPLPHEVGPSKHAAPVALLAASHIHLGNVDYKAQIGVRLDVSPDELNLFITDVNVYVELESNTIYLTVSLLEIL